MGKPAWAAIYYGFDVGEDRPWNTSDEDPDKWTDHCWHNIVAFKLGLIDDIEDYVDDEEIVRRLCWCSLLGLRLRF